MKRTKDLFLEERMREAAREELERRPVKKKSKKMTGSLKKGSQ